MSKRNTQAAKARRRAERAAGQHELLHDMLGITARPARKNGGVSGLQGNRRADGSAIQPQSRFPLARACLNREANDETPAARATAALRRRFEAEERQAVDAMARWIGHPAVREVIERRRIGAETVIMPIERLLTDQIEVIRFCWHVYGMAGIEPGWELRQGQPWLLTPGEMNAIERVEADFRGVVQLAVNELDGAGAGLVPSWNGDHVVVGELLLLDIDWQLPPRELAAALQPPAIGAIHLDASGTIHRRGIWERAETNIAALRRSYEQHLYGPPRRAPYAGGGTRALPEPTRRRREALRKVLQRWPDVTASTLWTTFGDHGLGRGQLARTPGGYLRQLLEQGAEDGELVTRPSKSTLHADLTALRVGPGQKPSA